MMGIDNTFEEYPSLFFGGVSHVSIRFYSNRKFFFTGATSTRTQRGQCYYTSACVFDLWNQYFYLEWIYSNNIGTGVEWKKLTTMLTGEHAPPTSAQYTNIINLRRAPSVQVGEGGDIFTYWVREGDTAGAPNCQIWRYRVTLI